MFNLTMSKNKAILRVNFRSWQHQKRSNSARLPSKNGKLSAELAASYQCVLRFVHSICLKYCPCHEKVMPGHTKHLSRKIILANLNIWCSKMQPLSGNQRPDLLTSLMNMSLVLRLPREMHLSRSSSNVPRLPSFLELLQNPHVLLTFGKVHNPLRLQRKTTSEPSKVIWARGVFNILTWKCASRHSGVHLLLISTSKSAPNLVCFVDFDFEMCFVPQRRALFAHLNFQKCSEPGVLCRFWLRNVLRATMACAFSISQLPKVLRRWGVLYILTWKCASRHKGVHFFDISASKSAPSLKCFARFDFEMCFAPQRHPIFHLSSGQMAPHPPL